MFFALLKASGAGSAFLDTDYSFDDVEDPMIMAKTEAVQSRFLQGNFHSQSAASPKKSD